MARLSPTSSSSLPTDLARLLQLLAYTQLCFEAALCIECAVRSCAQDGVPRLPRVGRVLCSRSFCSLALQRGTKWGIISAVRNGWRLAGLSLGYGAFKATLETMGSIDGSR